MFCVLTMEARPPDPPDPPDPSRGSLTEVEMELSPPVFTQPAPGSKRRLPDAADTGPEPAKKSATPESVLTENPNFYTDSVLTQSPTKYTDNDKGPFIIHVSVKESNPSAGTFIRPLKFGQFLVRNKVKNIKSDGVKKVGRNRISVEFKTGNDANNFLLNQILGNNNYVASIPNYNVSRMGVVRGIPTDMSMKEFVESLEIPVGFGPVVKARRLNRKTFDNGKTTWVPTQSVVITIHGQSLPDKVCSFHNSLPVETYLLPTIQCLGCCRFGHTKALCRSKPRCYRCAQAHFGENCSAPETEVCCCFCSTAHFATDKSCPEQQRQRNIKSCMSQDNISYQEAAARFKPSQKSYSDVAKTSIAASPSPTSQLLTNLSPSRSFPAQSTSYRKTVSLPSRSRAPLGKSYDKQAHNDIVKTPSSSLPNGCALNSSPVEQENNLASPNDNLLDCLCMLIFNILSRYDDIPVPSHVALRINQLYSLISKNGHCDSVEL